MGKDEPIDAGDEKQVKERKSAYKLAREQEIVELQALLETRGGRAFIWRLLDQCGIYRAAFGDPYEVARGEGKRDVGLWVIEEVFTANSEVYTIMRSEAVSRETKMKGK